MLPPVSQERELSHQFRAIKRPLIQRASEPPTTDVSPRTLMISSALPGDDRAIPVVARDLVELTDAALSRATVLDRIRA